MMSERDFIGLNSKNMNSLQIDSEDFDKKKLSSERNGFSLFNEVDKKKDLCSENISCYGLQLSLGSLCEDSSSEKLRSENEKNGNANISSGSSSSAFQIPQKNDEEKSSAEAHEIAQWNLWNKAAQAQKFMPFNVVDEERTQKRKFDQTGFQTVTVGDNNFQKSYGYGQLAKGDEDVRNGISGANSLVSQHFGMPVGIVSSPVFDKNGVSYSNREKSANALANLKAHFGITSGFKAQDSANASWGRVPQTGAFPGLDNAAYGSAPNGAMQMRNENQPGHTTGTQLTIFYGGSISVYENVPPEKAQTIMLLANSMSRKPSNLSPQKLIPSSIATSAIMSIQNQSRPSTPACSAAQHSVAPGNSQHHPEFNYRSNSQVSEQFQTGSQPRNSDKLSTSKAEIATGQSTEATKEQESTTYVNRPVASFPKSSHPNENSYMSILQVAPKIQSCSQSRQSEMISSPKVEINASQRLGASLETGNTKQTLSASKPAVVPRALPQARKASLTRFLEKRKERVPPTQPCTTEKPSDEASLTKSFMPSSDGCKSPESMLNGDVPNAKRFKQSELAGH